jgi:curved DNA-binding protein
MEFIDYYKILEIDKKATSAEVKKAYRKLARKYHPDLNPNDAESENKFKQVNEANEVLGDPEKRKKYDQYGKEWQQAEEYNKNNARYRNTREKEYYSYAGRKDSEAFSDFFANMFGGENDRSSGSNIKFRGQDLHATLQLNLINTLKTHKQPLTVNDKNIRITIPAGIEDGQTIKIANHGGPGRNGGPKGDLFISFSILNNTSFHREKANLFKTVELPLTTAVLGGEISVDTINGKVKLTVVAGTQNGKKIKLKGKGFPEYKKRRAIWRFIYNI